MTSTVKNVFLGCIAVILAILVFIVTILTAIVFQVTESLRSGLRKSDPGPKGSGSDDEK